MKLVRLTRLSGEPVYVNPDHVARVYAHPDGRHGAPATAVVLAVTSGDGVRSSPDRDFVQESVEETVALLADSIIRRGAP